MNMKIIPKAHVLLNKNLKHVSLSLGSNSWWQGIILENGKLEICASRHGETFVKACNNMKDTSCSQCTCSSQQEYVGKQNVGYVFW